MSIFYNRDRTEKILQDMRNGNKSEWEAERELARQYNDGVPYGVHEAVRNCSNGWRDVEDSAKKIDNEYRIQEYRERQKKEEESARHQ